MDQHNRYTWCIAHQRTEDQATPWGLVCPDCKRRLYLAPPSGRCFSCWESQPVAFALDGRPQFVYTLIWDDFRIRSLHAADSEIDLRSQNAPREAGIAAPHWLSHRRSVEQDHPTADGRDD